MENCPAYLEVKMRTTRLLLPFTHGVDIGAIEQAILLAEAHNATLVPLTLIHVAEERRAKGARLEHVQQSKDYLESVKHKAARYAVPLERLEIFTSDVVQSINLVASEMECEGIILFIGHKDGILLQANEIKRLLERPICKFYIMRLQTNGQTSFTQMLRQRFSNWLNGKHKQEGESPQVQECPPEGEVTTSVGVSSFK
jgi:hypothetical protein